MSRGVLWCTVYLMCISCAQIRPISGGDKDSIPPVAIEKIPPSLSTNFSSREFTIAFDEYVALNNINQELTVSPPLKTRPSVKIKGKSVNVEWKDTLMSNTTYTFNFGDGIIDVHEGNIAKNLLYVFSTGPVIDSLIIRGSVFDAFTTKPLENIKVGLYETGAVHPATDAPPVYFSKTEKDGSFIIPYLRDKRYRMVAFDDADNNYKLSENESAGFISEDIQPERNDSSIVNHNIFLSLVRPQRLIIEQYDADSSGALFFKWDSYFDKIDLKPIAANDRYEWYLHNDSVHFYLTGEPDDRLNAIQITYGDSVLDTIDVPFFREAMEFRKNLKVSSGKKIFADEGLTLESGYWFRAGEADKIRLLEDSIPVEFEMVRDSLGRFVFSRPFVQEKQYRIVIPSGAFVNSAGIGNDSLTHVFSVYEPDDLGTILLSLSGETGKENLLLQLVNNNQRIIRSQTVKIPSELLFDRLTPGEYTARIIHDVNSNGRWDPGDYKREVQPERVWIPSQTFMVRANWDVKIEWVLSE